MSAAERQRICRAKKRGELVTYDNLLPSLPPGVPIPDDPNENLRLLEKHGLLPAGVKAPPALPGSAKSQPALPAPAKKQPALPAPPITAIQKAHATSDTAMALADDGASDSAAPGEALRLSLPPAVADRLRSLLARQNAGKSLTSAERAEAQGLLDIAEYFVVQRLRRRLAA
jgi:hypothetical protein